MSLSSTWQAVRNKIPHPLTEFFYVLAVQEAYELDQTLDDTCGSPEVLKRFNEVAQEARVLARKLNIPDSNLPLFLQQKIYS